MIIILLVNRQEYFKRKDIEKKAKKFQARQENQANAATDESKYDTSTKAYALILFYLKTFREKNGSIVIRQEGAVLHFTGCEEGTTREDLKASTCTCTSFKTCCICCHVDGGVEWSCFAFFVSLSLFSRLLYCLLYHWNMFLKAIIIFRNTFDNSQPLLGWTFKKETQRYEPVTKETLSLTSLSNRVTSGLTKREELRKPLTGPWLT